MALPPASVDDGAAPGGTGPHSDIGVRALARKGIAATRRVAGTARAVATPSVFGIRGGARVMGLTFDDGPDPRHTRRILDALEAHGMSATFFMLVSQAEAHPDLAREVAARGHEVGLHGVDHARLPSLSLKAVVRAVAGGRHRLQRVVGQRVRLFRPPFGFQDTRVYAVARASGMRVVAWSADAEDWLDLETADIVARGTAGIAPGGILLLHDRCEPEDPMIDSSEPAATLDRPAVAASLVSAACERGIRFVGVGELLRHGTVDARPWFWA